MLNDSEVSVKPVAIQSRRQPELVNGFVPLATETGEWLYFAPADVKRVQFTPVPAEQTEQTAE
ncbi:hypothetical protein ASV21_20195 [Enterobacter hormaechei subsp. steigerwaltii]|nr:hypothetical protein ASV21_20195 [Enterobacter hormaechei subsp. steigerwaltii]KTJ56120.1 hypothetical protein ASU81_23395 [Enterobacter hormaechei subsp. steigerwaltii]